MRVVEEVALDAPGLIVDLLPHRARLNVDLPAVELQRAKTGFGSASATGCTRGIVGRGGRPGLALSVKYLLSVEGHGKVVHILHDFIDLPLAEVKLLKSLRHIGKVLFGDHSRA